MTSRILIADDHTLIREGLTRLLKTDKEIEVVGEAENGYDALEQAKRLKPDIILLDLYMPGLDGISATKLIKTHMPDVCIVMLTVSQNEEDILEAVYAGANGYIYKDTDPSTFIQQVKCACAGDAVFDSDMMKRLLAGIRHEKPQTVEALNRSALSNREKEVLDLVTAGLSNKAISSSLTISINTTRSHVRSLMQKLQSDNRTQLATAALREGLTADPGVRAQKFDRSPMHAVRA